MEQIIIEKFKLIGLKLEKKTTNEGGQSGIDCGYLWQKFMADNIVQQIPNKLGNEIFAVYYDYEQDYTKEFSYFIGCKVAPDANIPNGMDSLIIDTDNYTKISAKGKMPECVASAWMEIWKSDINRQYRFDFEKYDERSFDWSNAELDIYVSTAK